MLKHEFVRQTHINLQYLNPLCQHMLTVTTAMGWVFSLVQLITISVGFYYNHVTSKRNETKRNEPYYWFQQVFYS